MTCSSFVRSNYRCSSICALVLLLFVPARKRWTPLPLVPITHTISYLAVLTADLLPRLKASVCLSVHLDSAVANLSQGFLSLLDLLVHPHFEGLANRLVYHVCNVLARQEVYVLPVGQHEHNVGLLLKGKGQHLFDGKRIVLRAVDVLH